MSWHEYYRKLLHRNPQLAEDQERTRLTMTVAEFLRQVRLGYQAGAQDSGPLSAADFDCFRSLFGR
jgi:hypothetical protein